MDFNTMNIFVFVLGIVTFLFFLGLTGYGIMQTKTEKQRTAALKFWALGFLGAICMSIIISMLPHI